MIINTIDKNSSFEKTRLIDKFNVIKDLSNTTNIKQEIDIFIKNILDGHMYNQIEFYHYLS